MSNVKLGELRINNWYESVKWKQAVMCEMSDIVQIYYNADGAAPDEDHIAMVFEPIPLTEYWLKRFGCIEQRINSTKKNYWNKELDFSVDVEFTFVNDELLFFYLVHNQERRKPLRYVHQLQNLHFALKDVELTLTDKVE